MHISTPVHCWRRQTAPRWRSGRRTGIDEGCSRGDPEEASLGASAPTAPSGSPPPSVDPLGSPRATLWDSAVFVAAISVPQGYRGRDRSVRFGVVRSVQPSSLPQSLRCLGFGGASMTQSSVVSVNGSVMHNPKPLNPNKSLPDLHL